MLIGVVAADATQPRNVINLLLIRRLCGLYRSHLRLPQGCQKQNYCRCLSRLVHLKHADRRRYRVGSWYGLLSRISRSFQISNQNQNGMGLENGINFSPKDIKLIAFLLRESLQPRQPVQQYQAIE